LVAAQRVAAVVINAAVVGLPEVEQRVGDRRAISRQHLPGDRQHGPRHAIFDE
jgi:hypothetical protein